MMSVSRIESQRSWITALGLLAFLFSHSASAAELTCESLPRFYRYIRSQHISAAAPVRAAAARSIASIDAGEQARLRSADLAVLSNLIFTQLDKDKVILTQADLSAAASDDWNKSLDVLTSETKESRSKSVRDGGAACAVVQRIQKLQEIMKTRFEQSFAKCITDIATPHMSVELDNVIATVTSAQATTQATLQITNWLDKDHPEAELCQRLKAIVAVKYAEQKEAQQPTDLAVRFATEQVRSTILESLAVSPAQIVAAAMVRSLDPYSQYLRPERLVAVQGFLQGNRRGIGATVSPVTNGFYVSAVQVDGPAALAGVRVGDTLRAKAPVGNFVNASNYRSWLSGAFGREIKVQLLRGEAEPVDVTMTVTETGPLTAPVQGSLVTRSTEVIGVIKVDGFYDRMAVTGATTELVRKEIVRLNALVYEQTQGQKQTMDLLVLDVSCNSGGVLPEAVELAAAFMGEPVSLQIRKANNQTELLASRSHAQIWSGAVQIVTSRATASSAEAFVALLQSKKRALVYGEKEGTYGKSLIQTLVEFSKVKDQAVAAKVSDLDGGLVLTVERYFVPGFGAEEQIIIKPDVVFGERIAGKCTNSGNELSEAAHRALQPSQQMYASR